MFLLFKGGSIASPFLFTVALMTKITYVLNIETTGGFIF